MSKSKEKLKEIDEKIEQEKQKQIAKIQLEAAREIAMRGFSKFGVRDFFENKFVRAGLMGVCTSFGLFFGILFLNYSIRTFEIIDIFTGSAISGIPNYVWWIIAIGAAIGSIILVTQHKKRKQ
ncbi:MAG: hypothetical protein ACFFDN_12265 [Candidatus Hodarchaeota archaeon]